MKSKAHPGFKKVASTIAKKEGVPLKNAKAILASSGRNASPQAKAKNFRLSRITGK